MKILSPDLKLEIFFSNLKSTLGTAYPDLLEEIAISPNQPIESIPLSKLNLLANRLNITIDSIYQDKIDLEVLKAHWAGEIDLPNRYRGTEFSSRFTSMYMINFIKKNLGEESGRFIMQRYQLKENHFKNLTEKNNILLPSDICDYIKDFHGIEAVEKMGESSLDLMAQSGLDQNLKDLPDFNQFLESFFGEIMPSSVEQNYHWQISRMGKGFLEVKGSVNADVIEGLGQANVVRPNLEILRKGFLKSIPKLFGQYSVNVTMLKSISQGADFDLYRVEYFLHRNGQTC